MSVRIEEIPLERVETFYGVGQSVRNRNGSFEIPWSETKDIEHFLEMQAPDYNMFVAERGSKVGRLMAFRFADQPEKGFIGWYECDNDDDLSEKMLETSCDWLISLGVSSIGGPMNGSSWGSFRFNKTSSNPLFVTEPYQPIYYVDQWCKAGFVEDVTYETHLVPKNISRPMPKWFIHSFLYLKGLRMENWPRCLFDSKTEMTDIYNFFVECFSDNSLYRSVNIEQFEQVLLKLETIIDFENSYLVKTKNNRPVSVLISYKDIYHEKYREQVLKDSAHKTKTLYMKTIATSKVWRGKHISRNVVNFGLAQAYKNGYENVVFGTMMIDNKSAQYSKSFFDAEALRTYVFMKNTL